MSSENNLEIFYDKNYEQINTFFGALLDLPDSIQVYALDINLNYILFNKEYKEKIKQNFNIEIKTGDNLTQIFKGYKDLGKEIKILKQALSGEDFRQVGNYKFADETTYYKDIYKPVRNNRNEIIGVIVFYTDITHRKKNRIILESLLNISEKTIKYNSLSDYIAFICSELNKIIDTKNFFVALYDEIEEKYTFPFFVDEYDDIDTLKSYDLKKSATDYVRRSGKTLVLNKQNADELIKNNEIDIIGTPSHMWIGIPLNTENGIIGVMVTQNYEYLGEINSASVEILEFVSGHIAQAVEKKQAEQNIIRISEDLQYAQSIAKLGRCEVNLINSKVILSSEAKKILGFDQNINSVDINEIKKTILGNQNQIFEQLTKPNNTDDINEVNFKIVNTKDRKIVYLNTKSKIKYSSDNIPVSLVIMIQDITQQEKDKNELKLAKEKSETADKLKSAFLANMSHEIRTPMNAILGFSKLLVQENLPSEKREQYAEYINNSGNNLMQLINDIIDVAKIEAGQLSINKAVTDINKLLDEVKITVTHQRNQMKKSHLMIFLNKTVNGTFNLFTDAVRLRQILLNLLGNALKFTEKGSIDFGYMINDKNEVIFYVQDTGPGIPKDKEDVIFSRFGQIIDNEIVHPGGTGLGLSITKNLAELLGGNIYLDSIPGKGAKFSFNLPLTNQATPIITISENTSHENISEQNKTTKNIISGNKCCKILIVEDNLPNRTLVTDIIYANAPSSQIEFAQTGEAAKRKFLQSNFDLIFMDIKLPDIDGIEVTKFIRKTENPQNRTPIVALSAHAMADMQEKALDAGVDEFISKPFIFEHFINIFNKYLNKTISNKLLKTENMSNKKFEYIDLSILTPLYATKPEKLKFIVEQYAKTIDDNIQKTQNFLHSDEPDKLKVAAHSLKSSTAYLGLNEASEIAKEIEHNSSEKNIVQNKIKDLIFIWEKAKTEIDEFVKS